jgi:hypothetical protein
MFLRGLPLCLLTICLALGASAGRPLSAATQSATAGLELQTLDAEDLDMIQEETGYRVGVLVLDVTAGSPAANAGILRGDLLLTVGQTPVASAQAVDTALAAGGRLDILYLRGETAGQCLLTMPAATSSAPAPASGTPPAGAAAGDKLEALDAALAAGIITQEEYARKKTQLESEMRAAAPATAEKLAALKAAYESGILTEEEYARKKAEIEAQAGGAPKLPDEETRRKLAALEQAHESGILNDQEFDSKKAELLGDAGAPAAPPGQGKTYRHPIGFTMWHPTGWQVLEQEGALQLAPPDPATRDGQPAELYFVTGESVAEEGITRSDDPQVTAYMNEQVAAFAPQLKAKGITGTVPLAHGSGTIMDWEAQSPTGEAILARAYIAIVKQSGVSLIAMGQKDKVMAREQVLRKVFTSFSVDEGERDPAVVGTWHLVSEYSTTNRSPFEPPETRASIASETKNTLVLRPDGTWQQTIVSHFIAIGASNPITGGSIVLDSGPERKTYQGRWNAGNGALYLMSQDDRYDDYKYQVRRGAGGRELVLVTGGRGKVWSEGPAGSD